VMVEDGLSYDVISIPHSPWLPSSSKERRLSISAKVICADG
jgi:hypothetical protein